MAIPKELLDQVGLGIGDLVYVALAEDPDGALLVLPAELVTTWVESGRKGTRRRPTPRRK